MTNTNEDGEEKIYSSGDLWANVLYFALLSLFIGILIGAFLGGVLCS